MVPCGKCVGCRLDRARVWAVRCMLERKLHDAACFVTLTYNDAHLPPLGSLQPDDLARFWKRLRKAVGKVRYFAAGEYGTHTARPHYHAIIFGWSPPDLERISRNHEGSYLYTSAQLTDIWTYGATVVGECTAASAAYVARYCSKAMMNDWEADDRRVPPFTRASRNPGLGGDYYETFKRSLAGNDTVVVDNQRYRLPRYFLEKIACDYPDLFAIIKANRLASALAKPYDGLERLAQREAYRNEKAKMLLRDSL